MARIPDEQIERLKEEVPVQRLAEAMGVELERHGADLIGLCPFHDDHEPSLVISPQKNLWHCLGACQAGGSVIDWVMKAERVSFRHAVELLRSQTGIGSGEMGEQATESRSPKGQSATTTPIAPLAVHPDDQAMLRQVIDHYHEALKQSPEALASGSRRWGFTLSRKTPGPWLLAAPEIPRFPVMAKWYESLLIEAA